MTSPAPTPLVRRPSFWLVIAAALLAVVVAVAVGVLLPRSDGGTDAAATPSITPSAKATPAVPAGSPTATAAASGPVIPADCAGIYTRDWGPELTGLVLNPVWTTRPENQPRYSAPDAELDGILNQTTRLVCSWARPEGPNDVAGLTTIVAQVSPEQQASVVDHLRAASYSCYDELSGTRCVIESEPSADGQSGESHFLREGIWSATHWLNVSPDGYTHDIVAALFGA